MGPAKSIQIIKVSYRYIAMPAACMHACRCPHFQVSTHYNMLAIAIAIAIRTYVRTCS